jgi:ferritin-like metal-binding protein YciE
MTSTASAAALLHVALQDLHAGKMEQVRRLPAISAGCSDAVLAECLRTEAANVAVQAERLLKVGGDMEGPSNLWMRGILNDAERDARHTQRGRLLDIALTGAIRKAKAAEIVSSETAQGLATGLGLDDISLAVEANRQDEIAADRRLKACLDRLTRE